MKRLSRITAFVSALVGLAGLALVAKPAVVGAADEPHTLSFDVACDCRTGSPGFFTGNRGEPFIVNGKICSCRNASHGNRRQ